MKYISLLSPGVGSPAVKRLRSVSRYSPVLCLKKSNLVNVNTDLIQTALIDQKSSVKRWILLKEMGYHSLHCDDGIMTKSVLIIILKLLIGTSENCNPVWMWFKKINQKHSSVITTESVENLFSYLAEGGKSLLVANILSSESYIESCHPLSELLSLKIMKYSPKDPLIQSNIASKIFLHLQYTGLLFQYSHVCIAALCRSLSSVKSSSRLLPIRKEASNLLAMSINYRDGKIKASKSLKRNSNPLRVQKRSFGVIARRGYSDNSSLRNKISEVLEAWTGGGSSKDEINEETYLRICKVISEHVCVEGDLESISTTQFPPESIAEERLSVASLRNLIVRDVPFITDRKQKLFELFSKAGKVIYVRDFGKPELLIKSDTCHIEMSDGVSSYRAQQMFNGKNPFRSKKPLKVEFLRPKKAENISRRNKRQTRELGGLERPMLEAL